MIIYDGNKKYNFMQRDKPKETHRKPCHWHCHLIITILRRYKFRLPLSIVGIQISYDLHVCNSNNFRFDLVSSLQIVMLNDYCSALLLLMSYKQNFKNLHFCFILYKIKIQKSEILCMVPLHPSLQVFDKSITRLLILLTVFQTNLNFVFHLAT